MCYAVEKGGAAVAKILIVEDESAIRELLLRDLRLVGHAPVAVKGLREARAQLDVARFDLILLDIMLGRESGFSLLEQERETPVICLTAKGGLADKLRGLNLGADDYIVKPFETLELIARIQAVLRRTMKAGQGVFQVDDVRVDFDARQAAKGGVPVELTPQEFALLEALAVNRNLALSRERILDIAWSANGFYGDARTVDVHVSRLRQKLGLEGRLKTVYKVGYRLETRDEV